MSELEDGARVLLEAIAAARTAGATEQQLAAVVLRSGWRPLPGADDSGTEVLDGLLASGRHVPILVRRAA